VNYSSILQLRGLSPTCVSCGLYSAEALVVRDYLETQPGLGHSAAYGPLGGVVRPRRKERFARLMQRRVRILGGPAARAACGGNLKPDRVATQGEKGMARSHVGGRPPVGPVLYR
jgi:hypothetical protein